MKAARTRSGRPDPHGVKPAKNYVVASEPGTRKSSGFFDSHPRFIETSQTSALTGRLNLRYEAIFAENRDIFQNARVLDLASHDGRWSCAALEVGAASVVGVEARAELVKSAQENLAFYGFGSDRHDFIVGDAMAVLQESTAAFDVVLCLGFLYHTLRYNELLYGIRRANPGHVVIDTVAPRMMSGPPQVYVRREAFQREGNAVKDAYSVGDSVLVGQPNFEGLLTMMSAYDFRLERLSDWDGLLRDNPDVRGVRRGYGQHNRITARFAANSAADVRR